MALGKRLAKSTRALSLALEPSVQRAYRMSVRDLIDNIDFAKMKKAIAAGDVEAAVEAANIDSAWMELHDQVVASFTAGGRLTMELIAQEAERARRGKA